MEIPQVSDLGFGIRCLDANYVQPGIACFYLLQEGDEYALVETGTSRSVPQLLDYMAAQGIAAEQIRYVIPTHVHLDHAGGAGAMMEAFPAASLLIHPRGARHMAEPSKLVGSAQMVYGVEAFAALYGEIQAIPAERIREMGDGESVSLGERVIEFRHTRGHANHHMCVWDAQSSGWFTGDMFGVSYPWFRFPQGDFVLPSTTPTQFDPDQFMQSLDLLASYKPQRLFLTHYGQLAYSDKIMQLLRAQVLHYCELAGNCQGDGAVLQEALLDYTLELLQTLAPDVAAQTLREWAAFDVPLNTQGLLHWLQQRA